MNKNILVFAIVATFLFSCGDNRTPQQKAEDDYKKEKAEKLNHEHYIDSLVNVASGVGEYEYQTENRKNALETLKKEYPGMSEQWAKIESEMK